MKSAFMQHAQEARDRYVAFYRKVLAERADRPNFVAEALIKPNGRTTPEPFCLMRVDVLAGNAPNLRIEQVRDTLGPENPVILTGPNGLRIELLSFSWEALRLCFSSQHFRIEQLGPWLEQWLDPGGVKTADACGLSGVVHDMAWASSDYANWQVHIDFGSAPSEALEELLGHLSRMGVRELQVSRYDADG